jgi:hypothetical protein
MVNEGGENVVHAGDVLYLGNERGIVLPAPKASDGEVVEIDLTDREDTALRLLEP